MNYVSRSGMKPLIKSGAYAKINVPFRLYESQWILCDIAEKDGHYYKLNPPIFRCLMCSGYSFKQTDRCKWCNRTMDKVIVEDKEDEND